MKALCADDSRIMRRILADVLQKLGYECLEAKDGVEALQLLRQQAAEIRLVLLDWNMPQVTGVEVLQAMRKDDALREIPVIMVTTEGEKEKEQTAMEAGANGYVAKPFKPDELVQAIANAVTTD